jgi:HK97 family phage prohead protease
MSQPSFYVRALPDDLEIDDTAGTAEGIFVPWDTPTPIVEAREGGLVRYSELFRRGAFDRALRAPGRVPFTYGHSDSFADRLGVTTELEERDEGLWGRLRLDRSKMDAARDAITSSHRALSIAFYSVVPKAFTERDGSTVERRSVILQAIAAVPAGAYEDARILAVRNLSDELEDETAAEVAAREAIAQREAILAEADALIAAGERWRGLLSS